MNKTLVASVLTIASILVIGFTFTFTVIKDSNKQTAVNPQNSTDKAEEVEKHPFAPPSMNDVPEGEEGELIKLGYRYANETSTLLDEYVGNKLSCASCHANGGYEGALDLVGISKTSPSYNPRAGKEVTLEDRINGCFRRSMNGKPLPTESEEMKAMVAFYDYISQNVPDGTTERPWARLKKSEADIVNVDLAAGEELYNKACIACHASGDDAPAGLALWGDDSYNIGAGMARKRTAAGFIQTFMPKTEMGGYGPGTLTDEEAMNIAAYINAQERPDFPDKIHDWPNGDAPDDSAYETLAGKKQDNEAK